MGRVNYAAIPEQEQMLMDILEGFPPRPHEWTYLVAKGYTHYSYSAKQLKERKAAHRQGVIYQAQADIHQSEFASLNQQLGNQLDMRGNKLPKPLPAQEKNKELS